MSRARTDQQEPRIDRKWLREPHAGAEDVAFPVVEFAGGVDGPTVAIMAGMHGGEYAGALALQRLLRDLERTKVTGRIIVIPIINPLAFFGRKMQHSPVDEHELHYLWPGRPEASHSEHVIDLVFRTVGHADAVVDMHAGEFVQDLTPYVGVPWESDGSLFDRCLELAAMFPVPFVDKRAVAETDLALPRALLAAGIPNLWTEIGRNGLTEQTAIDLQYQGALNVLRLYGSIPGSPVRNAQRMVGPRHWTVFAEESGVWIPEVSAGQCVVADDVIGRMYDVFGAELHVYLAEAAGTVEFSCTSPAIDVARRPNNSTWHQLLAQIVEDPAREREDAG